MRSQDDEPIFLDIADAPEPTEPRPINLARPSGVVEILQPLAHPEEPAEPEAVAVSAPDRPVARQPSRSNGWLAVVGAIAVVVLVLGLFLGRSDPALKIVQQPADNVVEPVDEGENDEPDGLPNAADETDPADLIPDENAPPSIDKPAVVRSVVKRRFARTRPRLAAYRRRVLFAAERPRRRLLRAQFWVSDFVPTTLVIYVEKGEIKTRIEPQITAGFRKSSPAN